MSSSQEDGKGDVKERAVANIMKLINSQIALERKQSKMADKDKDAKPSTRMADLEDTIEKLVQVAKRKGYIDQDATVETLKAEAQKGRESQTQEDAVSLMAAMKKNLDAQTAAVTEFMTDRVNHDAEWEENAWAKLLNSNQDILVLMARLHDRGFINQEMIDMATLPDKPPPPREQDMRGMGSNMNANGAYAPSTTADGSVMQPQYGNGSMMGYGQPMHPGMQGSMGGSMMNGMMPNGMMPNGMMPNGMMPNGMMPNGMMPQQSWGMGGSMPGSMMGMQNGGMMPNGMMQQQMMPNGSGMPMNPSASFMSKGSGKAPTARDEEEDSSSGSEDSGSEAELNERLRELKGLAKEREKGKKTSRAEQVEKNLFGKHKGIGHFNNAFKVADDIRQLGAVPEDEETKDPGLDKQMAKAMEDRLLRNIEEDILRGKKDVIRSFMRSGDDAGGASGAGSMAGGSSMNQSGAAQSVMQMQMMQQQNMMALQQMMMSMGGSQPSYYGGPSGMAGGPSMPGGPSAMGGGMSHPSMMGQPNMMGMGMGSQMQGMNPMMGGMGSQMHPNGMGSQMGAMQPGMGSQMGGMQNGMGSQMGGMGSQMQGTGQAQTTNGASGAADDSESYPA